MREYKYEITVLFLFASGIFLLLEKMNIKRELFNILKKVIFFIMDIIIYILSIVVKIIRNIEISDLIGMILIMMAFIMVITRIRTRIIQRFSQLSECPKCGEDLNRAHRTRKQKLLGWLLYVKVMHFSCKKCDYHGLQLKYFT